LRHNNPLEVFVAWRFRFSGVSGQDPDKIEPGFEVFNPAGEALVFGLAVELRVVVWDQAATGAAIATVALRKHVSKAKS
jgi:hypothetical protein